MSHQIEPLQKPDSQQEDKQEVPLATSAARASIWVAVSAIITQLTLLVNSIFMARILTPAEFGVVEICLTIALFVNLIGENGFSAEIVQHKELSPRYLSTAFWSNVGIGLVLSIVGMSTLWLPQLNLDQDAALLLVITMLNFVFSGFGMVQRVLLVRSLRFSTITWIEMIGIALFTVSSVVLALAGLGGLGYIIGWMLRTILVSILFFFSTTWRPGFQFYLADFKSMAKFGVSIFAGRVLVYANSSVDRFLVLNSLGGEQLGYYTLGRRMPTAFAALLYSVVLRVSYPVMSRVQSDSERMVRLYVKTVELLALLVIPPMILLAIVAELFVVVVFGEQWLPAVFATRMMALTPLFVLIVLPSDSAFPAVGRPDLVWKNYALRLVIYLPCVWLGVQYSVNATGVAALVYAILAAVVTQLIVRQFVGVTWFMLWQATWPTLRNSLLTGVIVTAVMLLVLHAGVGNVLALVITCVTGLVVYLAIFRMFNSASLLELIDLAARATNQPRLGGKMKALLQL